MERPITISRPQPPTAPPWHHTGLLVGSGALLLLLLAALAYGYLNQLTQQTQRIQRELQGLKHLTQLRDIIEPLQVSRGLLVMQAADQLKVTPPTGKLAEQEAAVGQAFAAALAYQQQQSDPLGLAAAIAAAHEEWRRLRQKTADADPREIFAAFTPFIEHLLALHRQATTASGLDLDPVASTYNLIQILDLMLEFAIEPTGQIRALYTGALAAPMTNPQTREQLLGRAALLDSVAGRIEYHASLAMAARPILTPKLNELPGTLRQSAGRIRELLYRYPVDAAADPDRAQHFFTGISEVITTGYHLYDTALQAARTDLEEQLAATRRTLNQARLLSLLVGLFTTALVLWGLHLWRQHQRDLDNLHRQSHEQRLLTEISSRFLKSESRELDRAIQDMLAATGTFLNVDRAYLFRYSADGSRLSNTNEWCAPGVSAQQERLQDLPVSNFPWWQQQLQTLLSSGGQLLIADVDALPEEAAGERETLRAQQIRSLCCVPVGINDRLTGFIGFDSLRPRRWQEDKADHLLTVAANLLSAALERENLEQELTRNAITDGLTGLFNRRHFFELLAAQLEKHKRDRRPFAVAMFDIDHFKRLNDTYGHLAGDCVLREFATLLKEGFRSFDIVARYGGEEFVVLLTDSDGPAAATIARRLLATTRDHIFACEGENLRITVSGGVTEVGEFAPETITPETLVDQADHRLYQAKAAGRDRVVAD